MDPIPQQDVLPSSADSEGRPLAMLELMLLTFGHWAGILLDIGDTVSFALTVFIVYLAVNLISWYLDSKEASKINKTIKALQG